MYMKTSAGKSASLLGRLAILTRGSSDLDLAEVGTCLHLFPIWNKDFVDHTWHRRGDEDRCLGCVWEGYGHVKEREGRDRVGRNKWVGEDGHHCKNKTQLRHPCHQKKIINSTVSQTLPRTASTMSYWAACQSTTNCPLKERVCLAWESHLWRKPLYYYNQRSTNHYIDHIVRNTNT